MKAKPRISFKSGFAYGWWNGDSRGCRSYGIWGECRVVGKTPFVVLSLKTRNLMTAKINVPIDDRTLTRKTILLVEDDRDDEELTRRALLKSNIRNEVIVAHDGQEALDLLFGGPRFMDAEMDQLPAVVLLDLKLPKVNGIEVLR
jgi:hypothetical protein